MVSLSNHDVLTAYDLDLAVHCACLVLRIRRNERCFSRSEDALLVPYTDAEPSREHIDYLLLGMFVRLGARSSCKAVSPDFDLPAFDCGPFGRGVLRADDTPLHCSPVIEWHGRSFLMETGSTGVMEQWSDVFKTQYSDTPTLQLAY